MFLALSVLACLQIVIFKPFQGLEDFDNIKLSAKWTISEIGMPKNLCSKNYINWEKSTVDFHFKCEGNTQIDEVISSGVISFQNTTDYAGIVEVFGKCYYNPDPTAYDADQFFLMEYFDTAGFNSEFLAQCHGE